MPGRRVHPRLGVCCRCNEGSDLETPSAYCFGGSAQRSDLQRGHWTGFGLRGCHWAPHLRQVKIGKATATIGISFQVSWPPRAYPERRRDTG